MSMNVEPVPLHANPNHDRRARLARPIDRDHTATPPAVVSGLIDLLSAPGGVDLDEVTVALQKLDVSAESLGDAVYPDGAAYVRTLLYRDDNAELLALTWLPGQRSPVHDHCCSDCIVRIVEGVATEILYRQRDPGAFRREHMQRALRPGVVTRSPGNTLHSLGNNEPSELLVTLHIYTPPLQHD
jgi:cysteine dioxygenase